MDMATAVRGRNRAKLDGHAVFPRRGGTVPRAPTALASALALLMLTGHSVRAEDPTTTQPPDYPVGTQTDTRSKSAPSARGRRVPARTQNQPEDDDLKITGKPAFQLKPSISLRETYTDNVTLLPSGAARSDFVTEVAPDLSASYIGPNAILWGNIGVSNYSYARDGKGGRTALRVNTNLKSQPVEHHLFIDANATVSEQSISSFGAQAPDSASLTGNRTEVRTFTLAPRLQGKIGSGAAWNLHASNTASSTDSAVVQRRNVSSWDGLLTTTGGRLGVGIGFIGNSTRISSASGHGADQVFGVLNFKPDVSLSLALRAGQSSDTYGTNRRSRASYGGDVVWRPQPSTDVRASYDRLSYGPRVTLDLNHRRPLSAFNIHYSEDVITSFTAPSQFDVPVSTVESLTSAGLSFLNAQNVVITPALTNSVRSAVTQYVQENGLPDTILTPLTTSGSGIYRSKRLDATGAFLGARNALTLKMFRARRTSAGSSDAVLNILDFLPVSLGAIDTASTIDQYGGNLSWQHTLTSLSNLTGRYTLTRSESTGATNVRSVTRVMDLTLHTRLSPHIAAELALRRATQDATTSDYTENALIGRVSLQY
ncbi:MAG: TIGR03016 family PEP-CTERM system-associated outer membrane protein [Rhodocyclaceae bacterium]|nr:TIGR03016 family PEP-CTERM system-associated outer membrane protein [Rhodocyclaceae bacterium]MBX3667649.1 TIGR03016 family PEP-CTERM system-associated outer membrane protein [Rhodocyclaceae bacterium]